MAKQAKKKPTKKKQTAARKSAPNLTEKVHREAFKQLVAHAHSFAKPPLCYKEFPDGSAQVCKLMPDGTYGDCESYTLKPVPGPRCG